MPGHEFYAIDTKPDEKKQAEFITWHRKSVKENYIFDFQTEMYKYCSQDVTMLRLCCVEFRNTFLRQEIYIIAVNCAITKQITTDLTVNELDPPDSFFGGRVGGYKLFCELKPESSMLTLHLCVHF